MMVRFVPQGEIAVSQTAMGAVPTAATTMSTGTRLRSIFGGSIGNLIEWYDFYVYNSFALYFAKQFSGPNNSATQQFVNVFAIYAIGFLVRPVGGYILG